MGQESFSFFFFYVVFVSCIYCAFTLFERALNEEESCSPVAACLRWEHNPDYLPERVVGNTGSPTEMQGHHVFLLWSREKLGFSRVPARPRVKRLVCFKEENRVGKPKRCQ